MNFYPTTDNCGKTLPSARFDYIVNCKYITGVKNIYLRVNVLSRNQWLCHILFNTPD